ncbi:MAG: RidA family protein [Candidatus Rokuibacteriota bacterium]|nr:MAG: RidA family protein [Candidatus Rokubacteria bacterium]
MSLHAVPGPRPGGPYSPGIVAEGRFVFVSGQGPLRDGAYVAGTIEEETRLTLDNLLSVLAESGSGPQHVVRCGVWLTDLADFAGMNSVYADVFPDPRPARATVQAQLIVGRVEIDCIAVVPSA